MNQWSFEKHQLVFKKPATTSRGALKSHTIYLIKRENSLHGKIGIGECSPLPGLSVDDFDLLEDKIASTINDLNKGVTIQSLNLEFWPALNFAIETANLAYENGICLFNSDFTKGKKGIPVNGLVWMADPEIMLTEAIKKAEIGFACIKFKIGALDFKEECSMLEKFRKDFPNHEIRLDANGAFSLNEVMDRLKILSQFNIQSIEQPIQPRNWEIMAEIVASSPIPIALDEELIGVNPDKYGDLLISSIKPNYLVLKPTLLGGLAICDKWISLCSKHEIGWWATSALESNVGLNAIAQWASTYPLTLAQGFGTGMLFEENFKSDLNVKNGMMWMKL